VVVVVVVLVVVVIVITGAKGTISKSFRKYLSNILAKHKFKKLGGGGEAIIGHCTHTSESTIVKLQNI
jgi:hypothetical protein